MKSIKAFMVSSRVKWALFFPVLLLVVSISVPAQHDMSKMPGMSKPKAKSKTTPRKKRKPARKKPPAKKHDMSNMPGMNMPAQPSSSPKRSPTPQASPQQMQMDMPGMQMPAASPSPTASPRMENMPGMQMPASSPSPSASPQMESMPGMPGMQMPTTIQPGQERRPALRDDIPDGPALRLEDLERMAIERNPTLAQADSSVEVSRGRRRQAGLFPNPIAGYSGENFGFRAMNQTSSHSFFVEQTIPLGGKLSKAKSVFAREADQAQLLADAQRARVINSVRMLYYEAVGAQRLVDLRIQLGNLARDAVEITKELYNVGQADHPDQLEIEIEAERMEIDLLRAKNDREEVWRSLGAMVSNTDLRPVRLTGNLEEDLTTLNQDELLGNLLINSPEIKAAQANVERARAILVRARAERIPDLFLRGGVGYSNEILETDLRKTGTVGRIEAGVNVPIFNRNQGGIAAAEAELAIAEREQQRLQLVLRARFASAFREYKNAQQAADKYRTQVIPRARTGYEMYLSNFKQMAAAYPQVLIAQRTLFQVEVEYARSLIALRQSGVRLRGFLLTGGLDALSRPGEFTEGFKLRSPNETTGGSNDR